MSALVAVFVSLAPIPVELGPAWASFTRAPANRLMRTEVDVGTLGFDSARNRPNFWLRRTIVRGVQHKEEVTWTDTESCAPARPLIASMRDIPVPKLAPVGSSKGPPIVLDGIAYSLRTDSDQGKLTMDTNIGTPLAGWIENALKVLDSCWTPATPQRTT